LNVPNRRIRILFVCGGNTCRSPMAKAILQKALSDRGVAGRYQIDSAAYGTPTHRGASKNAREAIIGMLGTDLLADHIAKSLDRDLAERADLILVMNASMKRSLPSGKTHTLKEYAGGSGGIQDPYGGDLDTYFTCAKDISQAIDAILPRIL